MEINRLPNESYIQYKIRLCKNREEYGITWLEVSELLNIDSNANLSPDTYRKEWASYSKGYSDGISEQIKDDEILKQIDDKKLELQKIKFKISDQRAEMNKTLRSMSRFEDLKDLLAKEIRELANVKPLENTTCLKPVKSNRSGVLPLADWHYGMKANNQVNFIDDKEFRRRVEKLLQEAITRSKEHGITKLHVPLIGDELAGLIHTSIRVSSYETVIKQLKLVCEILANFLYELSRHFDIDVYSVYDNHSRLSPNKSESINDESLASLIPWFLEQRLSHILNIRFIGECSDSVVINVEGNKVLCVHGHNDKPENANDLAQFLGIIPDVILMGHWHNANSFEQQGVQVVVSGSLIGSDEYASGIRKYSVPSQKLLIFEEGKQGILCEYNIRVAEKRKIQ